jgi:ATP-binding protein involved in chromosome partitioning
LGLVEENQNKNNLHRTLYAEGGLAEVRNVVAVGSSKGGVGKSTVCLHLAVALADSGYKVGVLDADMFGPSIPLMTGSQGQTITAQNDQLVPVKACGISLMSMGFCCRKKCTRHVERSPFSSGSTSVFRSGLLG